MSSRTRASGRLAAVGVVLFLLGTSPGYGFEETRRPANPETVTLGIVSPIHPGEVSERFGEFANYVARKLSHDPQAVGKVIVVSTPKKLAELLEQGEVDFYMESSYPTYVVNDIHGAGKMLLRRWKGGMAEYQSLIFTRDDNGIENLESLKGKVIAFEDPGSTSGFFLPKSFLSRKGFELTKKDRPFKNVSQGEVGYIFALSPDALIDLVLNEKAAAGAFSSDDFAALDERKKTNLKILARTGMVPRHLLSVRKDLCPDLGDRLEKILLAMHEDEEGRAILRNTDDTTKFDALPGGEEQVRQLLLANFHIEAQG